MDLIRALLLKLEAEATDRGFSFEEGEAETLKCTLDEVRYNLQQAEQTELVQVGSKLLNGEWINGEWKILRLTPKGHDFLERGQNTERPLMNALKEPERITLAEGLTLLERHVPTEKAKARLRDAFTQKAFPQSPSFAFEYDEADIDWTTGSVKILRKRDSFCPTRSSGRTSTPIFFERSRGLALTPSADRELRKLLGAQASDDDILSGRAEFASQACAEGLRRPH